MKTGALLTPALRGSGILGTPAAPLRPTRERTTRLGHPGHCPGMPTLTIIISDDSGSLYGPSGNDPVSNRYGEARRALDTIARHCRCGQCLAPIIHFDALTSGCVGPTPLIRRNRYQFASGLGVPRDAAGTSCLGPSLARAEELVADYPDHQIVLIILTDWELFDADPIDIQARIVAFPGTVFAIGLRNPVPETFTAPNINSVAIAADSLPGTLARAVFDALTVHRQLR